MKMEKLESKKMYQKGITLIALVITIIVLLILAGISIASLTGENGILNQASQAGEETKRAEIIEKARLDILEIQTENESGNITEEQLIKVLEEYFNDVPQELPDNLDDLELIAKEEYGGYKIQVSQIWNGEFKDGIFNPETLTIGTAKNTDKYGWKVTNYTVQTSQMSTNVWRLFYQDSKNTYLIVDKGVGRYQPSNYYENYVTGADVSIIGQRLNSELLKAGTFFTTTNTNANLRATAWLTDTSDDGMWKDYKNSDAIFAIRKSNNRIICSIL